MPTPRLSFAIGAIFSGWIAAGMGNTVHGHNREPLNVGHEFPGGDVSITYTLESDLSALEFRAVLIASTLGERRPVADLKRLDKMLRNADIVITARDSARLVGISRAITDFAFCCYLSDLAVEVSYQRQGIGRRLIQETHLAAGAQTSLLLVAAPAAESYYPKVGLKPYPCFGLPRSD